MADNIKDIGIKFKKPNDNKKMLTLAPRDDGCHKHSYIVDPELDRVTCANCDKVFNPMAVLTELTRQESRWMMNYRHADEKMKRLSEKQRTKCNHCGKMTKIKGI